MYHELIVFVKKYLLYLMIDNDIVVTLVITVS